MRKETVTQLLFVLLVIIITGVVGCKSDSGTENAPDCIEMDGIYCSGAKHPFNDFRRYQVVDLESKIEISLVEKFIMHKPLTKLALVLKTDKVYPSGCYGLARKTTVDGDTINIEFFGISVYEGPCAAAMQTPEFHVDLKIDPHTTFLVLSYKNQIDRYRIDVEADEVRIKPMSDLSFTVLPHDTYFRIPENSVWVHIGYSDREKFSSKNKELVDRLLSIGAKQFVPRKGKYTYGGFWGSTSIDNPKKGDFSSYGNLYVFNDFLYFEYRGEVVKVPDVLDELSGKYAGGKDMMLVRVWMWQKGYHHTWKRRYGLE